MSLSTLEQQVVAEWSWLRAQMALHPWIATVLMIAAGWAAGRLKFPI